MAWIGRDGKRLGVVGSPGDYLAPRLSPDARRVALQRSVSGNLDVWLFEFGRGVLTRLTFDPGFDNVPVWSPDGSQVAFSAARGGPFNLFRKEADGARQEERLTRSQNPQHVYDWSPDGRYLLYRETDPQTRGDLWVLPLGGDRRPVPFLRTPSDEMHAQFSRDGKWIAYSSDETGRYEIYVQPFQGAGSGPGGKWQVSNNGGSQPRWRGDGRELFYLSGGKLMAVAIREGTKGIETESARELFPIQARQGYRYDYDVTADGQRFLVLAPAEEAASPLTVIYNWQGALKP